MLLLGSLVDGHLSNNSFYERRIKMHMNKSMIVAIVPARKHLRLALFCLVALSALVFLAACGGDTGTAGTTPTVGTTSTPAATATQAGNSQTVMIITDSSGSFAFSPASLTIKA